MAHVNSFEELEVYKLSRRLSKQIYQLTLNFPEVEKFSMTDQIRRSSRSIGAQIAEAWAKRKYPKHFVSKLTDADGEQHETRHWTLTALDIELFTPEMAEELLGNYRIVGRQLNSMIDKSGDFCR